ncbi:class I SAM-dependent methyltransferase [Peterkaempfera griseoplana]|uniref:class I SAM-dependent methyltransferase n=1 Tax=Peterkaempfera griseoplana TaxID=66896 RepID=UPI0006E19F6C|nr:class I SAM-dependent methyltransferase [Peterkaempfera griseoplana]
MSDFDEAERQIWAGRAEAFRDSFARLCAHTAPALLDAAGVGPGTRLLDVGTGSGTVAAAACARNARVFAVDAEPGMVTLARRAAPEAHLSVAALPGLPFAPGSFDAVVANFVINHVGRPAAALAALRSAAQPGGRVAATIWCDPLGAGHELLNRAVAEAGAQPPADLPRLDPADDFPRTGAGFVALFEGAGFTDVACQPVVWDHVAQPAEWWGGAAAGVGLISQAISRQDAGTVARIKAAYDRLVPQYSGPDGSLVLRYHALLARGRA